MHSGVTVWLKYSLVFYIFKHLVLVGPLEHSCINILCVNVDGKKRLASKLLTKLLILI